MDRQPLIIRSVGRCCLLTVLCWTCLSPAPKACGEDAAPRPSWVGDLPPLAQRMDHLDSLVAPALDIKLLSPTSTHISDDGFQSWWPVQPTSMLQPTPFLAPRVAAMPDAAPTEAAAGLASAVFEGRDVDRSLLRTSRLVVLGLGADQVQGAEAVANATTDAGDLLGRSPRAMGVNVQRRTPIVGDPRVRSSRIGSLAASGSHWVPARTDLDTALSKIDSRQLADVIIIPGPYSALYGPQFQFIDFELARSPRFADGYEMHGQSSLDFKSNGAQLFGQQSVLVGDESWGMRASYSHRRGGDYFSGDDNRIAAGYQSREFTLAYGEDLGDGRSIELTLLRLDQTDVEFPGYVFDIDYLVADGYTLNFTDDRSTLGDRSETELWYNRTRLTGNAQNPAKRGQFPFLEEIGYVGFTDVRSLSTGYRQGWTWGRHDDDYRLIAGQDLRFIRQDLQEIASGVTQGLPLPFTDRNSPVPDSYSVNPGLFAEYRELIGEKWTVRSGGRLDFVATEVVADPGALQSVGLGVPPATYAEIVGTDDYQQQFHLWSVFAALDRRLTDNLVGTFNVGYAQRPPTLTELYAAEPFMLLLQNGLNNVTGDPHLSQEQLIQFDLALDYQGDQFRAGSRMFHGWAFDYITFENTGVGRSPPANDITQVSLRSVNTDLATLVGFESFAELFPHQTWSPFATMRYTEGRDRTRRGRFATESGRAGMPSRKVAGVPRGFFSGVIGSETEPLPGISPLESRVGMRVRSAAADPRWNLELSARIVDDQNLVAASLLESPTPGFTTYDLRGTWRPLPQRALTLVGGVENVTDKQYREHLDFRSLTGASVFQPGINFYFGADAYY